MDPVLDRDVAWIRHTSATPGTLGYAIPADFAVYGVLDLPESIRPVDEALLTASSPDLLFPPDHSWLMSLLWDDSWRSIGVTAEVGQRLAQRVGAFQQLSPHVDLAATGREPN